MQHIRIAVYLDDPNIYRQYNDFDIYRKTIVYVEKWLAGVIVPEAKLLKNAYLQTTDNNIEDKRRILNSKDWTVKFGPEKKDIDTTLVTDAIFNAKRFAAIAIIGGDADYIPLFETLVKLRKTVYLVGFYDTIGSATIQHAVTNNVKIIYLPEPCKKCGGLGYFRFDNMSCFTCRGTGFFQHWDSRYAA